MSFAIVAVPNLAAWPILVNKEKEESKKSFLQTLQFPLDNDGQTTFGRAEILEKLDKLGFTDADVKAKIPELQAVSRKQITLYVAGKNCSYI